MITHLLLHLYLKPRFRKYILHDNTSFSGEKGTPSVIENSLGLSRNPAYFLLSFIGLDSCVGLL